MIKRIAREQKLFALAEQVFERFVDRPYGAMEIDGAEQLATRLPKANERVHAAGMNREPLLAKKSVAQEPLQIVNPGAVTRHVRIAEDKIHVVDRVQAAEQAPQHYEPAGFVGCVIIGGARDEPGNLFGIDRFAIVQFAVRAGADVPQQGAEFKANDVRTERFVG